MTRNPGGSRLGTSHSNEVEQLYMFHCHILEHENAGMMLNVMAVSGRHECPDEDRCGKRRLRAVPNRRTGRHEGGLPGRRLPRFARGIDPLGEIERTLTVVLAAVAGVLMLPAGTNIGVYFAVYWDVWAVVYLALTWVLILSSSPKQTRRWACVQRRAKGKPDRSRRERERAPSFTFVSDGIESALEQARAVAGEKDVLIGGGANVIQQYLKAGLVDEIKIHLAPMLLGAGIRLFDDVGPMTFERTRVVESPFTTHLWYRVVKP